VKRFLAFLGRLIAVSLLLLTVSSPLHRGYLYLLEEIGAAPAGPYDSGANLYTFVVLILGVPSLSLKKQVIAILNGIAAFFLLDLFMIAVWPRYLMTPIPSLQNMAFHYGWLVIAHYLLPFVLWLAFAFREIEALLRSD